MDKEVNYPKNRVYHGLSKRSFYSSYRAMIDRCTHPWRRDYKWYGGRGIKVCERWLVSAANFYEDMGDKPFPKYQLDRIDPDGNYELSNCRWTSPLESRRNKRNSKVHDHEYVKVKRELLCEHCKIKCKIDPID